MGEAKARYDAINEMALGLGFVSLTVFTAHGLVQQGSPLDPQPLKAMLFGKPGAPVAKELVELREAGRLFLAIAPHALLCVATLKRCGACGEDIEAAMKALDAVFAPATPAPKHECKCGCIGDHCDGCCCVPATPASVSP